MSITFTDRVETYFGETVNRKSWLVIGENLSQKVKLSASKVGIWNLETRTRLKIILRQFMVVSIIYDFI